MARMMRSRSVSGLISAGMSLTSSKSARSSRSSRLSGIGRSGIGTSHSPAEALTRRVPAARSSSVTHIRSWGRISCRPSERRPMNSPESNDPASVPSSLSTWSRRFWRRRAACQMRECSTAEPTSAAIGRSDTRCSGVKARGRVEASQTPPTNRPPTPNGSHIVERTPPASILASIGKAGSSSTWASAIGSMEPWRGRIRGDQPSSGIGSQRSVTQRPSAVRSGQMVVAWTTARSPSRMRTTPMWSNGTICRTELATRWKTSCRSSVCDAISAISASTPDRVGGAEGISSGERSTSASMLEPLEYSGAP